METGNISWFAKTIMKEATKASIKNVKKATLFVEREVKKELSKRGTGEVYYRGKNNKNRKFHIASAPYEPPAVDTGALRASISSIVEVIDLEVTGWVGSDISKLAIRTSAGTDLEYGYYLEMGTINMAPRPYLRPVLNRHKDKINRIIAGEK